MQENVFDVQRFFIHYRISALVLSPDYYKTLLFTPVIFSVMVDHPFQKKHIDCLTGLIKEPFPATMNFYRLLDTIGNAYAELFPQIQEKRPEVMDKLMGIADRMDEMEENARKAGFANR